MDRRKLNIVLFGHFGATNFGNEITLYATLHRLRQSLGDANFSCICSGPEIAATAYNIATIRSRIELVRPRRSARRLIRFLQKITIGIPNEIYRWLQGFKALWGSDALIVPGTGLLTDAYTLFNWGPYEMFRWAVTAKLTGCKLLFVSVGAGPVHTSAGRFFVKTTLSLANFRSYRDEASRQYLKEIGFRTGLDPVFPDLVFSLPATALPCSHGSQRERRVVGLGVMEYAGKYGTATPTTKMYSAYLESLAEFAKTLLNLGFDICLLIGDLVDKPVIREFSALLKARVTSSDTGRVSDDPAESPEELLHQIASTDFVVATRFHNVLFSMLLNKPVMAISFHHKCSSLMRQMGLAEYCLEMNTLTTDALVSRFQHLEQNADGLKQVMQSKVGSCQRSLEEQYDVILQHIRMDEQRLPQLPMEIRANSSKSIVSSVRNRS